MIPVDNNGHQLKEKIKQTWNYLDDDEIETHDTMRDVFFMAVRKKHGIPRAQAEGIIEEILRTLDYQQCEEAA